MSANFRANIGRSAGIREPLDAYQTPGMVTRGLIMRLNQLGHPLRGPVLEPAAGCGLLAAELRRCGLTVHATDINRGRDFLKRQAPWDGDLVTNPPYRDHLGEQFLWHALGLVSGQICLLMRTNVLHGTHRLKEIWRLRPPTMVLIVPWRIMFLVADGITPIKGQAYDHSWFIWDNHHPGNRPGVTRMDWINPEKST